VIFLSSKNDASKNKKRKPSVQNTSNLYEFANDQLGENKDAAFNNLNNNSANKQKKNQKKK